MDLRKPLFSIVIPLYNKEAYIAKTIKSVFRQTFPSFEVIVVNDGSTDQSLKVVQSFSDPRLKVYSKKNGGVSDARNFGIGKAGGEFIGFLDADDEWASNFLEEMKALIDKYPACGLYTSAYKRTKKHKTLFCGDHLPEGIIDDFFKIKLKHLIPWTSAIVVRKGVFDNVGGFPLGMIGGEDDYTWAKIAVKYPVAFTPKILAKFNEVGSSSAFRLGKVDTCRESWFDFYEEGNFYRNEFVARKAIYAAIRYAYSPLQYKGSEIEKLTRYTVLSKRLWWDLYILNRMPHRGVVLWKALTPRYKKLKHWLLQLRKREAAL